MPHQPRVHGKIITKFQDLDYRNQGLFHPVAGRLTVAQALTVWLLALSLHLLIWSVVLWRTAGSWSSLLEHWDAAWYLRITKQGYDAASAAFLTLFPYAVRWLAQILSIQSTAAILWLGSAFSLVCFFLSFVILFDSSRSKRSLGLGAGALVMFLFSPASYIFHSFHTESLFLLLSVLGFHGLKQDKWISAAIWAGLAALVMHQGVFLALAIALGAAFQAYGWKQKLGRFAAVGLISGLLWSLAPVLHYAEGRGVFPALSAHQDHWFVADGLKTYFRTFILGNPIQNYRFGSFLHQLYYFVLLFGVGLVLHKGRWAEGLYCLFSLAMMPLQGELMDAFRFAAVLFPVLFALGEYFEARPRWVALPVFALSIALNLVVTWQYAISRWAY